MTIHEFHPVPTLLQPQALAEYLANQPSRDYADSFTNAVAAAERAAIHPDDVAFVGLSFWGQIKEEFAISWEWICEEWRDEKPLFLATVLSLSCLLGVVCTLAAVKWWWIA